MVILGERFIFNLKIEFCESAFGCLNRRGLLYSMFILCCSIEGVRVLRQFS